MNIRDFAPQKRQYGPVVLEKDGAHQATVKEARIITPQGKPASLLVVFALGDGTEVSKFFAINSQSEKGKAYALRLLNSLANCAGLLKVPDDPGALVGKPLTILVKTGPWWKDKSQECTEVIGFKPAQATPPEAPKFVTGDALEGMPF